MAEPQHMTLRGEFIAFGTGSRVDGRGCDVCGWDDLWTFPGYRVTAAGVTYLGSVERCARCRDRDRR